VGNRQRCIAIDRYVRLPDNLAAIAATLEAMRAIERHGGAEILDRAFTGFTALPSPEQWFQVLKVPATATREQINDAYRRLAMEHHPDRGGSADQMARINQARDDGFGQAGA
jgi:DnaJ-domain-containing protein 1